MRPQAALILGIVLLVLGFLVFATVRAGRRNPPNPPLVWAGRGLLLLAVGIMGALISGAVYLKGAGMSPGETIFAAKIACGASLLSALAGGIRYGIGARSPRIESGPDLK